MTGAVNGFTDRLFTLDEEGFAALLDRQPLAIGQIEQLLAFTLDLFEENILIVGHDHGHAPGQLAVEAGNDCRHTGQTDAGRLIPGRAKLYKIPRRGHRQR